jgi:hypothetical protein
MEKISFNYFKRAYLLSRVDFGELVPFEEPLIRGSSFLLC